MMYFEVQGRTLLKGDITPAGNKNEALPVISAALLSKEDVILENVPDIKDVRVLLEIIADIGVSVEKIDAHTVKINASTLDKWELDEKKVREIRASITLIGPIITRLGKVSFPLPGGDKIGRRRIDTHLLAMEKLGVEYTTEPGVDAVEFFASDKRLKGAFLLLDEPSVTGTENAIMAAVCAVGHTTIYNAACEPHVQGLCNMLNTMGAKITGIGTNRIDINGVDELHGTTYRIQDDHTEVGSFMSLAAVTGGEITVKGVYANQTPYIDIIGRDFTRIGLHFERKGDDLYIPGHQTMKVHSDFRAAIPMIGDGPWPLFPSDLTSVLIVAATQASGSVVIHEKMYENRMFFVDKLIYMGAGIVLCDPHRVVVVGPRKLIASEVASPDIRAGISLLIAALGAEGTSIINNITQIDRGYERIDERLNALGAKIVRKTAQ